MKKILLYCALLIACFYTTSASQVTQGFGYQAVVRDAWGNVIQNQPVRMRFTIHDVTPNGPNVFQQTDSVVPNQFGIITVIVGGGIIQSGSLDSVHWNSGGKFLQVEMDIAGGISYVDMGTTQLMSVPYALYSETAGSSLPGPQGATGATGNQGIAGLQGLMGPTGIAGAQGAQGVTGTQGIDGIPGLQGLMGASGLQGAIGTTGATGDQGIQGVQGVMGVTGLQGLRGETGVTGLDGAQGATGSVGATGAEGANGNTGATGAQGATGNIDRKSVV